MFHQNLSVFPRGLHITSYLDQRPSSFCYSLRLYGKQEIDSLLTNVPVLIFFFSFFFSGSLFIPILVLFEKPLEFRPQHLHSLRIYNFFLFLFIYLCTFSILVFYLFCSGRYHSPSEIEWQEQVTIKSEKEKLFCIFSVTILHQ